MKITLQWGGALPKSKVFGQMVKLAWPTLETYYSDLYHDAAWIEKHLEEGTFYFGVRPTGTSIGSNREHVSISNEHVYQIAITQDYRQRWDIEVFELKEVQLDG